MDYKLKFFSGVYHRTDRNREAKAIPHGPVGREAESK